MISIPKRIKLLGCAKRYAPYSGGSNIHLKM